MPRALPLLLLTAAVGSLGEQVEPQVQRFKLLSGDQLLLCTDGLTETVEDATIAGVLREAKSGYDINGLRELLAGIAAAPAGEQPDAWMELVAQDPSPPLRQQLRALRAALDSEPAPARSGRARPAECCRRGRGGSGRAA